MTVTEERALENGTKKNIKLIKKKKIEEEGTYSTLKELFMVVRSIFFSTKKKQFHNFSFVKINLSTEDVLIHTNFAEKLVCKYSHRIQSVH